MTPLSTGRPRSRVLASRDAAQSPQTVRCTCGGWLRQGVNLYGATIEWCTSCSHRVVLTGRVAPAPPPKAPSDTPPLCAFDGCTVAVERAKGNNTAWRRYCDAHVATGKATALRRAMDRAIADGRTKAPRPRRAA